MPTLLLADISSLPWLAIVAIVGGFLIAIIGMIAGIWTAQRKQQLWHETARLALEKGQPLPPPLDGVPQPTGRTSGSNDLRSGLVLIALGAGLYFFLGTLVGRGLGLVGAIPGFIGIALLLYGIMNAVFGRKNLPPADRPPQT